MPSAIISQRYFLKPSGVPTSPPLTNLILWLESDVGVFKDAGTTPAANNDTVQQWNDQSGTGNNESQATSANRPTFLTNQQNGKPAVSFTGNPVGMFVSPGAGSQLPYHIFMVVRLDSTMATGGYIFGGHRAPGTQVGITYRGSGNVRLGTGNANGSNFAAGSNTWIILQTKVDPTAENFMALNNGADFDTNTAGSQSWDQFPLGADPTNGAFAIMKVGEILVYKAWQTGANLAQALGYLNGKWAIY